MAGGENKRKHPRRPLLVECKLDGASGNASMRLQDLSTGGCYVDTRIPFAVGAPIKITTMLNKKEIVLTGRVAYADAGQGLGVEFEGLSERVKNDIAAYLAETV